MKILLVGPYPPPHGGVSVHLAGIARRLDDASIPNYIIDTSRINNWSLFVLSLIRFALGGWMIHFHANGHNWKDWSIAFVCGIVGRIRPGSILTLHSGLTPEYLSETSRLMRAIVRLACILNSRVICVSEPIRNSLVAIGSRASSMEVAEACLGIGVIPSLTPDVGVANWIRNHQPLLSTTLFFRPEYGFEHLIEAIARLKQKYPALGCIVMGSGEERDSADRRVRDANLRSNILLIGDVDHNACLNLISRSTIFVRATLRDGDSISVREALALGVTVVASRTSFRPNGVILFEPGDVAGLVSAIETALRIDEPNPVLELGSTERLMAIYRQAAAAEIA